LSPPWHLSDGDLAPTPIRPTPVATGVLLVWVGVLTVVLWYRCR